MFVLGWHGSLYHGQERRLGAVGGHVNGGSAVAAALELFNLLQQATRARVTAGAGMGSDSSPAGPGVRRQSR
jgi:hypothetical protein